MTEVYVTIFHGMECSRIHAKAKDQQLFFSLSKQGRTTIIEIARLQMSSLLITLLGFHHPLFLGENFNFFLCRLPFGRRRGGGRLAGLLEWRKRRSLRQVKCAPVRRTFFQITVRRHTLTCKPIRSHNDCTQRTGFPLRKKCWKACKLKELNLIKPIGIFF